MPDDIQHDGGPAFPSSIRPGLGGSAGISTRDYFAARALPVAAAHMIDNSTPSTVGEYSTAIATLAYSIADAMLAARGGT